MVVMPATMKVIVAAAVKVIVSRNVVEVVAMQIEAARVPVVMAGIVPVVMATSAVPVHLIGAIDATTIDPAVADLDRNASDLHPNSPGMPGLGLSRIPQHHRPDCHTETGH
jgi:hypothetical protein